MRLASIGDQPDLEQGEPKADGEVGMPDWKRSSDWSDSRFRQLVETAYEAIVTTDAQGRIAFANPRASELTGYPEEGLLGLRFTELYLPQDRAEAERVFERRRAGTVERREVALLRRDAEIRWVLVMSSPIHDESGAFCGVLAMLTDITSRRLAEQELADSAARLRQLNAATTQLAAFVGRDDLFMDRCAAKCLEVCEGDSATIVMHSADRVRVAGVAGLAERYRGQDGPMEGSVTEQILASGQPVLIADTECDPAFQRLHTDGGARSVIMVPLRAEAGIIGAAIVGSVRPNAFQARDLVNLQVLGELAATLILRRHAVQSMSRSEAQYRLLFRKHPKPMWVYDLDSLAFLAVNEAAVREYGWSEGEFLAMDILAIRPPEDAEHLRSAVGKRDFSSFQNTPIRHLRRNGEQIWVEVTGDDIAFNGRPARLVLASNVTARLEAEQERKRIEAQFLRAQRLESIGTLAGGIAHDLNNVLVPIMLSLELLKDIAVEQRDIELLDTATTSVRRGAAIVQQLLTFARGVEGQRSCLQVKHLIRDIESLIRETFPKNINLRTTVASDLALVEADATQLHQVLLNLVVNARDAMPDGGELQISAENIVVDEQHAAVNPHAAVGKHVVIRVADTGIGIPPELIQKVFDPFFTTKPPGLGTGLGLSTSQAIVRNHGGFLHVYSEPRRGTRFHVYLPAAPEGEVEPASHGTPILPRGNGELILVTDDEDAIRRMTARTLEAFGYRVLTAVDGADALSTFLQHHDIAAVITDMMMPVMDGYALIVALRRFNPKLRIIATSGVDAVERLERVSSEGVRHFLSKPFTAEALLLELHEVLTDEPATGRDRTRVVTG